MQFTTKMYRCLAWKILLNVFDESSGWSEAERKVINRFLASEKKRLTPEQLNFVSFRVRQMRNDFWEAALDRLRSMYWHELEDNEEREFIKPPVEFDEKVYQVWTNAVRKRKTVSMTYSSKTSGLNKRLVDPYQTHTPYGKGYCHLKKEVRRFRFDRVIEIEPTNETFTKPKI